jgi:hypothetical protein
MPLHLEHVKFRYQGQWKAHHQRRSRRRWFSLSLYKYKVRSATVSSQFLSNPHRTDYAKGGQLNEDRTILSKSMQHIPHHQGFSIRGQ